MINVINEMLKKYNIRNTQDEINALKEIIQEIVLCALSRSDFFDKAAFYGGTALRIFYGLDRFSEDLDFSLLEPNLNFDISNYFSYIENEAKKYGFSLEIVKKEKNSHSNITSAFLKGDTKEHILNFFPNDTNIINNNSIKNIKIKFEIDINPPTGATFETKIKLLPSPYKVKLYEESSLFAGKIHAILCRNWKTRDKGRDLYDYLFYISRNTKVNIKHLKNKLISSNFIDEKFELNENSLKELLIQKFNEIDYKKAKEDVSNFINDLDNLNLWSKDFFIKVTEDAVF